MNERIRELADEAGLRFTQLMSNPMVPIVDGRETDLEKFAELIVRECVGVADDYVKDCLCDEHIKCNHPQSKIGIKIKEHFGVK
jgi:hypothetical protein